ncbi:hypothetical protein [Mesorhizobium sp. 8]|uniref:hypothetical protein n=1 Tax=Mesorhizobium sp. 8 TaxID=2584466 RepID=UPI00112330BB|nr:hypothetical protein [Mesorhizobium sp. 8]QDC01713.1 hypothetical protein FGU64_15485 [Mesorhizobium sp. 8]
MMAGARRSGGSYFRPHPKSRQAFLDECVLIWCEVDADKSPSSDDPDFLAALKAQMRSDVEARLGSAAPDVIDYFTGVEFAAFQSWRTARYFADQLDEMAKPRPGKGNRRREVPAHLPLRQSRAIIAFVAAGFKARNPTASKNAIYAQTAEYLADGLSRADAGGKMTIKNVRDACESHGIFDDVETMMARDQRETKRVRAKGLPHAWDCGFYDWLIVGRRVATLRGYEDERTAPALYENLIARPTRSFERLYIQARAGKRFAGLLGADLARAIDAAIGLRAWVLKDMDALTPGVARSRTKTANAAG